jgi:hypothetical protein
MYACALQIDNELLCGAVRCGCRGKIALLPPHSLTAYVAVHLDTDTDCLVWVRLQAVFSALNLPFSVTSIPGGPVTSSLLIALALNKLTLPLRVAGTAAVVPSVARRLREHFPGAAKRWLGL